MSKNNTFKLGRSITQIVLFHLPIKKEQKQRDNHNKVGNNNGNNSNCKDCCSNLMDLRSNLVTTNLIKNTLF